jgi:hypothetical protein
MLRLVSLAALIVGLLACSANAQIQLFPTTKAKKLAKEDEPAKDDGKSLSEAKLSADDPKGLIDYLHSRTLSDEQLAKIRAVIQRMGDESFEERIKASEEAEKFGHAAIGPLRKAAQTDPDFEIQYRAMETLRKVDPRGNAAGVASAVARTLAKAKHPEAAAALLGFLPSADNATVEDDIRLALKSLAIHDGKLENALISGLKDSSAIRRSASGVALFEASVEAKTLQGEVTKLDLQMLKEEKDGDAKFRVAFVLATEGRNAGAFTALVEVIPTLPRGRIWQVEDVLVQFAGDKPPTIKLGKDKAALEKGSGEWLSWLKANRKPEDYAKFDYKPRTNGRFIMLTMDQNNNWNSGRISELGPDLRQRWRISGITTPGDFRVMTNGNIEVVEHNYSRVTERDIRGNIKKTQNLPGGPPMSVQNLENGNILVAYRQSVVEYNANWKALNTWGRNNGDVLAAACLGSGTTYALVQGNGGPNGGQLIRLDNKFKELPNPIKAGNPHWQAKLELLPNDRALVTEQNQVIEIDLKKDKVVWTHKCSQPTCAQRLPNGNTLICDIGNRSIREVAPDQDVVWTYTPPDGYQPLRAYRQ